MRSRMKDSAPTDSSQLIESTSASILDGAVSFLAAYGSEYLNDSTTIQQTSPSSLIDQLVAQLDVLIKDLFILGVFKKEYADFTGRKKTYSDFRSSGIVPDISINHIKYDPEFRAHFPLFANICETFDKLLALKNNQSTLGEKELLQQLMSILENFPFYLDKNEFSELLEKEDAENKSKKFGERLDIISKLKKYRDASITLAESAQLALRQKNLPKPVAVKEAQKIEVSTVAQTDVKTSSSQKPHVKRVRSSTKAEIEAAKQHVNTVWQSLVAKEQNPETAIDNIIKICIATLDEFIKDKFLLETFAKDFNTKIRNSRDEFTTFEEDFTARGLKTNFSLYRKRIFTSETFTQLMHAYPDDFLVFRQMVSLLVEITAIAEDKKISRKECVRQIFACFLRCMKEDWMVDVNVSMDLSKSYHERQKLNSSAHSIADQLTRVDKREAATEMVLHVLNSYFKKLNPILLQESKSIKPGLTVSVTQRKPIVNESLPLNISSPAESHQRAVNQSSFTGLRLFTAPTTLQGQKTTGATQKNTTTTGNNIYGPDLLGQVLKFSDDATTFIGNKLTSFFQTDSNQSSPILHKESPKLRN